MTHSFQVQDVIPPIATCIVGRQDQKSFMTHDELVNSLLSSTEGKALVEAAASTMNWEERRMAAIMIASFSQYFTTGRNQYASSLERKKIAGKWAYRAKQIDSTE